MSVADVVVIGGGVIGCALARRLAQDSLTTVLLERAEPGKEASWAAAGMLAPLAEADEPGPFLDLLRASRALFPALAADLLAESGIDIQYREEGTLLVALTGEDTARLEARYRWQTAAGFPVEMIGPDDVLNREPLLSPRIRSALFFPEDHQVDSRLLTHALAAAAVAAGVDLRAEAEALRLVIQAGRVQGVELASGDIVWARHVVVAAGSWAGQLRCLPRALPVFPVHGQLLSLQGGPGEGEVPRLSHVIHAPSVYLVPRGDARIILGATAERIGFRRVVTAGGVLSLLKPALEVAPGLGDAPLLESWSGLRPGTPDELPVLGRDPEVEGLLYATGHFRNGILLAPVTAEAIAAEIRGEPVFDLSPFSIARFARPRS